MPPEYRTRFAPSPTGPLHLGHAFSALTAWGRAQAAGGTCLLRIEDIDTARCKPEWEADIFTDLTWLGLDWPRPVWRQSERRAAYGATLDRLIALGLCYPCRCTRSDIRAALSAPQEGAAIGPDGPVYPGTCRSRAMSDAGPNDAIRLNIARACDLARADPAFLETGPNAGRHTARRAPLIHTIGDVVLARRDIGTSYHIAVVTDDAAQAITEVVRGLDLFGVTPLHVLLQTVLGLPTPAYHHHRLIRDAGGRRLAKRSDAQALSVYRARGLTPADIRARVGLT
jgi:glutamyl-Q tRNA(Asp) synthetase